MSVKKKIQNTVLYKAFRVSGVFFFSIADYK